MYFKICVVAQHQAINEQMSIKVANHLNIDTNNKSNGNTNSNPNNNVNNNPNNNTNNINTSQQLDFLKSNSKSIKIKMKEKRTKWMIDIAISDLNDELIADDWDDLDEEWVGFDDFNDDDNGDARDEDGETNDDVIEEKAKQESRNGKRENDSDSD